VIVMTVMACVYRNGNLYWIKLRHPLDGTERRVSLQTSDRVRAELLCRKWEASPRQLASNSPLLREDEGDLAAKGTGASGVIHQGRRSRLNMQMSPGTLPHAKALHAIELLGKKVAPLVRK